MAFELILEWQKVSAMINFRICGLKGCLVLSFYVFFVFSFSSPLFVLETISFMVDL